MKSDIRYPISEGKPNLAIRTRRRRTIRWLFRASNFGFLSAFGIRICELAVLLAMALLTGCTTGSSQKPTTLKDAYQKDFLIGVAVNERQFTGQDTNGVALITGHFNSVSPENALKWESIHPRPGPDGYNFGPADRYVEFGEQHGMYIVGHTLVWHSQTPRWVFQECTNRASRERLLERVP